MEIFSDSSKAYDCAMRRFVRQKSDKPVYIYRVNVARREMWAVLSAAEAKANKVSVKSCWTAIDGRYGLLDAKKSRQERMEEHADLLLYSKVARGLRQYHEALEILDKMGRNAEGVKRAPEVASDSCPIADPSC